MGTAHAPNVDVASATVSWSDSDGADTTKTVEFNLPGNLPDDGEVVVAIKNPSGETALSVVGQHRIAFPDGDDWSDHASWAVGTNTNSSEVVNGLLIGEKARLELSNDTALSSSGGFTAEVVVRTK